MDTRQVFTRFSGLLIFAFAVFSMRGQTPVGGGWGGIGDPSEAPGNPASSYALGSVDYVNYYSGSVNVAIPLPRIGGRGDVLKKQTAQIQRQWSVYANAPSTNLSPYAGTLYTPGQIMIVTASANPSYCYNSLANAYYGNQATSYIVWTSPEGSQTTLTDVKYGGQPLDPNGSCQPADRGAVFRSTDGSGLVFLATSDVHDGDSSVAGTFISRDGTKYTFQNFILMTQIEDRNGNLIQFTYLPVAVGSGATHFRATDSVGRIMNVFSQGNQTVISYPGLGGASRTVTVSYAPMQSALASGEVLQNYNALFPQLSGSSSTQFNPSVVSSIILADGTSYTMLYNSYGELVKLTLPTGGVIGYKYSEAYSGGSSGAIAFSDGSGYKIQRPLAERDEYSDGSTLSAKLLYSASAGTDPASGRPSLLATVKFEDPNGNVLRQENHYFYGNPLSNAPPPAANTYADWWEGLEYRTDVTDGTNTMQSTQRVYQQRPWAAGENPWFSTTNDAEPLHDPQLCQVNTTVNSSTSGAVYMYDQYNNPTDQYQFDFGHAPALGSSCPTSASGFLQHTNTSYLTSNAAGNYTNAGTNLVSLPSEVKVWDGSGNLASNTKYDYDRYDLTGLANCPGIIGHDNANFAGGGTRGNVSFVSQYLNTLGSWINTATRAYDIAGSIVWEKDGNGNPTSFFYADNYTDGNDSRNTCAFLTGVQNAKLQFPYQANHDYNTGKPVLTADLTGNYSVNSYGTLGLASDRLTQVLHARGTPAQTTTNFIYNSPTDMVTKQDQSTSGDVLVSEQRWDGFGRPVSAIVYEAGGSYIETDTAYDALGRVVSVTNPWRGGDTPLYTKYGYDALGRQTSVTAQDGIVTTTASYAANTTTVTDEAGKTKKLIYDALGRLTNVIEDPGNWNTSTSYTYTATTTTVNQCYGSSCQVRAFTNDTLGRQIAATNPESGTVSYTYDYAGNLLTKTDARHRTATYNGYDGLNRPSSVTYSDGTPTVNFAYDGAPNGTGQLTSIAANGISTTNYTGFDAMGRVTSSNQQIGGKTYNFSYGYNLAGALTSETYPSGRVATTSYNQVNRPVTLSGSLSGQVTNYVTDSRYWAAAKYWTIYGNSVWNIWGAYNARLQPTAVWQNINNVSTTGLRMEMPNWVDGNGHNNGTLQGTTILAGGPDSLVNLPQYRQTFGYDSLNRLTSASESLSLIHI